MKGKRHGEQEIVHIPGEVEGGRSAGETAR